MLASTSLVNMSVRSAFARARRVLERPRRSWAWRAAECTSLSESTRLRMKPLLREAAVGQSLYDPRASDEVAEALAPTLAGRRPPQPMCRNPVALRAGTKASVPFVPTGIGAYMRRRPGARRRAASEGETHEEYRFPAAQVGVH